MSFLSNTIERPEYALIPKLTPNGYTMRVGWSFLEKWILSHEEDLQKVDINPDFQRGHVWTEEQQVSFVEFMIRGGLSSTTLYWNHPEYIKVAESYCNLDKELVLVDGKHRLTAVRRFLNNEIKAFGFYLKEYGQDARIIKQSCRFTMVINDLKTRKELLNWYLELNDYGVSHSKEEIERVKAMLSFECSKNT